MKNVLFLFLFTLLSITYGSSQTSDVSGILNLKGLGDAPLLKGLVNIPASEKQAVSNACINAIDRAVQLQSDALRQQYAERVKGQPEREKQVRKLIYDIVVRTDRSPKEGLTHASVRGKLDISELRDLLNSLRADNPNKVNAGDQRSDLGVAVFFTVRRSLSKLNTTEITSKNSSNDQIKTSGNESITDSGIETNESKDEASSVTQITTNAESADSIIYVFDSQMKDAFGTGLMTKLAAKGFESLEDGSDYDASEAIDQDITSRGSPSKKTKRDLVAELKEDPDIELYIIGTLDFSIPSKDPITGLVVVNTTMSGKIYKIRPGKKTGKFVAGLGPRSFKGKGRSQEDAKKDILEAMAPLAADEIITALKNNNVIN